MKKLTVFYHANCPDGYLAAAIFKGGWATKLRAVNKDPDFIVDYVPISYANEDAVLFETLDNLDNLEKDYEKDIELIFLDYCPSTKSYNELIKDSFVTVIVDHHDERVEELREILSKGDFIIDNVPHGEDRHTKLSGAGLTHYLMNFFVYGNVDSVKLKEWLPKLGDTAALGDVLAIQERLTQLVSDYDTWTLKHPESFRYYNGLGIFMDIHKGNIDSLVEVLQGRTDKRMELFSELYAGIEGVINQAIDRGAYWPSEEYPVLKIINAPKSQASEIGRIVLANSKALGVLVYTHNLAKCTMDISIRTRDDADERLRAIDLAKIFDGGGHTHASGGRYPIIDEPLKTVLTYKLDPFMNEIAKALMK